MHDMSPADLAAIAGTFLAAVITGFGLRRGEAERLGSPAAEPGQPAGGHAGPDAETQRAILDELRDLHADMAAWRREDEMQRRAARDSSVVERFRQVEAKQAKILDLLGNFDDGRDTDGHRPR